MRLMVLRADTGEIVGEWPLTAERDVWAEAKALTEARGTLPGPRRAARLSASPPPRPVFRRGGRC